MFRSNSTCAAMKRLGKVAAAAVPLKKINCTEYCLFTQGTVDLPELARCVELALASEDANLWRLALRAVCAASARAGPSFARIAENVVRLVKAAEKVPQRWRWEVMLALDQTLGVSSTVYLHFNEFVHAVTELLQNDSELPDTLVDLVISVMSTSLVLLSARVLREFQGVVCSKALAPRPHLTLLRLLTAFLRYSHDEVSLPIQIAKSIFERSVADADCSYQRVVRKGREVVALCTRSRLPPTRLMVPDEISPPTPTTTKPSTSPVALDKNEESSDKEDEEEADDDNAGDNSSHSPTSDPEDCEVLDVNSAMSLFCPQ